MIAENAAQNSGVTAVPTGAGPTVASEVRTALEIRGESPERVDAEMKWPRGTVRNIVRRDMSPSIERCTELENHLGLASGALVALRRGWSPERTAAQSTRSKLTIARLRAEGRLTEIAAAGGRAVADRMTPEQRSARGRTLSAAAVLKRDPEEHSRSIRHAADVRRRNTTERGDFFVSAESRARHAAAISASGNAQRAMLTKLERYGRERVAAHLQPFNEERKKDTVEELCIFCGDEARLIPRRKSERERGRLMYHGDCFDQWRSTVAPAARELGLEVVGNVGFIASQIRLHGTANQKERLEAEVRAYINYLRNPARPGRPAKLPSHKERAIQAALLKDEGQLTYLQLTELEGRRPGLDGHKNRDAARAVKEDVALGRMILGTLDRATDDE